MIFQLEGKFPLDWNDLYEHTGKLHTLNGKKVKVTGLLKFVVRENTCVTLP